MKKITLSLALFALLLSIGCAHKKESTTPPPPKEKTQTTVKPIQQVVEDPKLTLASIENLNVEELRILRNQIFAKHGYKFKSKDLREYFANKGYEAKYDNVEDKLTETDKENISIIRAAEKVFKEKGIMLTLKDITIGKGVPEDFKPILMKFIKATYNKDTKTLKSFAHNKLNADFGTYMMFDGAKTENTKEETTTYTVTLENNESWHLCHDTFEATDQDIVCSFFESWSTSAIDAARDGGSMGYYFVKQGDTYKVICTTAAG